MSKELYELIEKKRAELTAERALARGQRDKLSEYIKTLDAQIDDLPVRKTRRPKKSGDSVSAEAVPAEQIIDPSFDFEGVGE